LGSVIEWLPGQRSPVGIACVSPVL